jgi:class 3 adenylate cyclase
MKQVTVLFCDIVGSTPLSEQLGPEAMRDLISSFLETSLAELQRFGGTAPQFAGDGFMALFGARWLRKITCSARCWPRSRSSVRSAVLEASTIAKN